MAWTRAVNMVNISSRRQGKSQANIELLRRLAITNPNAKIYYCKSDEEIFGTPQQLLDKLANDSTDAS